MKTSESTDFASLESLRRPSGPPQLKDPSEEGRLCDELAMHVGRCDQGIGARILVRSTLAIPLTHFRAAASIPRGAHDGEGRGGGAARPHRGAPHDEEPDAVGEGAAARPPGDVRDAERGADARPRPDRLSALQEAANR
eukprot:gene14992-biopygen10926